MITIVQSRNNKTLPCSASLSDVKLQLVCELFRIFVGPCASVDVEEDGRIPRLLGVKFVNPVEIYMESSNVDRCLAGSRRTIR